MILSDLYHLYKDLRSSQKDNLDFSKIKIGASFNPEHWALYDASQIDTEIKLKVAKFVVEELKIKDIRLSIRWSEVWKNGKINVGYYNEIFQYFFTQDVNICLNVGPIKTMRWPEEQVSKEVLNSLKEIPAKGEVITSESELGTLALRYLENLLDYLQNYFTSEQLSKIKIVQGNNESFFKFGEHQWTMSYEFEVKVINLIHKYFPDRKIMINTAGRFTFKEVLKLVEDLEESSSDYGGNFIIGYNYYYKTPPVIKFPLIGTLDNLITTPFKYMDMRKFRKICKEKNIEIEISEFQGEPWEELKTPGNSFSEFKFGLLRCQNRILNLNQQAKSLVRFWGVEQFALKFLNNQQSEENIKIKELIQKINS